MTRKHIAVLVDRLHAEYTIQIISGIHEFFKNKDVCLLVAQVNLPHSSKGYFDYQYWGISKLLAADSIDFAIFISGSFCNYLSPEELSEYLKAYESKRTISMGIKLPLKNSSYIKADCKSIFNELIKHLKEKHGCKNIAFVSANLTKSIESAEREEAFKEALKNNGLVFNPDFVIDSNFSVELTREVLEERFRSKDDIKFDCVVSANDLMALACVDFFHSLGISVPEDIVVTGFDDAYIAKMAIPPLTTINQETYNQGWKAAELAYNYLEGKELPHYTPVNLSIKYRQSCGCTCEDEEHISESAESIQMEYVDLTVRLSKVYRTLDIVQNIHTIDDIYNALPTMIDIADIRGIGICLYDEPIRTTKEEEFELPDKAYLTILIDNDINLSINNYNKNQKDYFNPHESLIPDINMENGNGTYIVQPIFYGEVSYGYMLCKITKLSFYFYSVVLKIFANTISQAYDYSLKINENSMLSELNDILAHDNTTLAEISRIDELTKIYNRRGFLTEGQHKITTSALGKEGKGLVIFGDLDGLKSINDTYGHEIGDLAIKTIADVLKRSFRSSDIVARLSGDEFAMVIPGVGLSQMPEIRNKIQKNCEIISKENNLPFIASASFGVAEYSESNTLLKNLLSKADSDLYEQKKLKHAAKKS